MLEVKLRLNSISKLIWSKGNFLATLAEYETAHTALHTPYHYYYRSLEQKENYLCCCMYICSQSFYISPAISYLYYIIVNLAASGGLFSRPLGMEGCIFRRRLE